MNFKEAKKSWRVKAGVPAHGASTAAGSETCRIFPIRKSRGENPRIDKARNPIKKTVDTGATCVTVKFSTLGKAEMPVGRDRKARREAVDGKGAGGFSLAAGARASPSFGGFWMDEKKEFCADCRFFKEPPHDDHGYTHGDCRRFPLRASVSASDWCGEFEDRELVDAITTEEMGEVISLVHEVVDRGHLESLLPERLRALQSFLDHVEI